MFSGKKNQNYLMKDEKEKLKNLKIDGREKALAYCNEKWTKNDDCHEEE